MASYEPCWNCKDRGTLDPTGCPWCGRNVLKVKEEQPSLAEKQIEYIKKIIDFRCGRNVDAHDTLLEIIAVVDGTTKL